MAKLLKVNVLSAIGLLIVIFISFICYQLYLTFSTGEWSAKNIAIWNEMHIVSRSYFDENEFDKEKERGAIFLKNKIKYEGELYDVLAIPLLIVNDSANPYALIITNTHVDNDYALPYRIYITPGYASDYNSFNIRCTYLDKLLKEEKIDQVVSSFLRQRCN